MFVHKSAVVIGDVALDENASVFPGAVIRGDRNRITICKNSNVQDNVTIHSSAKKPTFVGKNVSLGHSCVVHGCHIEDNCLIGMNATILEGARIKKGSIVGASALVTENKEFETNAVVVGVPAKKLRETTKQEHLMIKKNAEFYQILAEKHKKV